MLHHITSALILRKWSHYIRPHPPEMEPLHLLSSSGNEVLQSQGDSVERVHCCYRLLWFCVCVCVCVCVCTSLEFFNITKIVKVGAMSKTNRGLHMFLEWMVHSFPSNSFSRATLTVP